MNEMKDSYNRRIDYLRISVTDKCNLRCKYCMPEEGIEFKPHSEILSYEEMVTFTKAAVNNGISKVRLTGGEPLVRKNFPFFIEKLAAIDGLDDISLTTNGILLTELAEDLKKAGLKRVNISLDTLDEKKFRELTRCGDLEKVLKGMEAALAAGLEPVKINVVAMRGVNDDPTEFVDLVYNYPIHVRFIELMEINNSYAEDIRFISEKEIREIFKKFGQLEETEPPIGAGPAVYFKLKGAKGTIGFICPESRHLCSTCNRLRLTADGFLRVCLFSDKMIDIKEVLRQDYSPEKLDKLIKAALEQKPKDRYTIDEDDKKRSMWQIGG